ncbi:hypothetical protein BD410DRAFT_786025 [Rickenella mellea]|uniref:Uncharacterized protein n=1 Tax=Rickenella mellea TaxID=50990 RepID=A0A4Y7QA97_9AGAM|nr:hypothetical protein BD410DRAFT_786025 [Rickenella mellea]
MTSSPFLPSPVTPARPRFNAYSSYPLKSSPLAGNASSSPLTPSPIAEIQARRRSQYKAQSSSSNHRPKPNSSGERPRPIAGLFAQRDINIADSMQKDFLRERFKTRCVERARKAREKTVREKRRWDSDGSSDGFDIDMDLECEPDDDADDMDDELLRRIIANERRKDEHALRLSYELDVGSSIDPSMEEAATWEAELKAANASQPPKNLGGDIDQANLPPSDLDIDDEELAAWYEEYLQEAQQGEQIVEERPQQHDPLNDDDLDWMDADMNDILDSASKLIRM